jgi:hypothetical protein
MGWIPAAAAVTVLAPVVYAVVQHDLRSSANDPQVQMAEDGARRLDAGAEPESLTSEPPVDVAASLRPYTIVFDRHGWPLASSARLHGGTPIPPPGALASAAPGGRNVVTWQPAPDVRQAAVIVAWRGGYVLVGRSLRLVEQREDEVLLIALGGWSAAVGAAAVASVAAAFLSQRVSPASGLA